MYFNLNDEQRQRILDFLIDVARQSDAKHPQWWWSATGQRTSCACDRPEIYADRIFAFVMSTLDGDGFFDEWCDDEGDDIDVTVDIASQLLGGPLYPPELIC